MDFNFLNCACTLNIPTGNIDAFAHETKIMAKSAIKANNYSHTITFIVPQLKTRTCWIKNKQEVHTPSRGTRRCNLSCNYHKLHINNKTNVGKIML